MKVFVTGATGYIGFNVARAFRRAGHSVFGLCRSEHKAVLLYRHEIVPVLGDLKEEAAFRETAARCSVIIHAAMDFAEDAPGLDKMALQALIGLAERGARPKTLIYTSGVWVHGNTGPSPADETSPLNPPAAVAWRPAHERMVLESMGIRGIVIRPGCVYGEEGGLTGAWFTAAAAGKPPVVIGDGLNRWAMVHVDDLADCYVRAGEIGRTSEAFIAADRSRASLGQLVAAAAAAAGWRQELSFIPVPEAVKSMGQMAECLAMDQHVSSDKAERLLGWRPRHLGFADEARLYFEAWQGNLE